MTTLFFKGTMHILSSSMQSISPSSNSHNTSLSCDEDMFDVTTDGPEARMSANVFMLIDPSKFFFLNIVLFVCTRTL